MAQDKKQDGQEIQEDDEPKPNKEIFLEKDQRDPDEAVFAEQAIHHYANDVLDMFREQAEMAMSQVDAFLQMQSEKDAFNERFFLETLGDNFLDMAMGLFGGKDSPIATAIFPMLDGMVDMSARGCDAQAFVNDMSRELRDASWYLRDNLQAVLSNQWDELRDLAYEGSTDFIPALHAYGLPQIDFDAKELSTPMIDQAQLTLDAIPKMKEETLDQSALAAVEDEEKKLEAEPEIQNMALDEEKKEAVM
jgi:hypothetical protein